MVSNSDVPTPETIVSDMKHTLNVAYRWGASGVPTAAVIFNHHSPVLHVVEVVTGNWATLDEARAEALLAAQQWLHDHSGSNWNPHG